MYRPGIAALDRQTLEAWNRNCVTWARPARAGATAEKSSTPTPRLGAKGLASRQRRLAPSAQVRGLAVDASGSTGHDADA